MGKAKPFIDKANARHFHLVNRQHNPLGEAHGAQAHDTDEEEEWDEEYEGEGEDEEQRGGLENELASMRVSGAAPARATAPGRATAPPKPDEMDEFGFTRDGYDYSKHMRAPGGGTFVPATTHGERPPPVPIAEVILRDDHTEQLAAEAAKAIHTVAGAELVRADVDLGDLDDELLAALEMPGLTLVHRIGGVDPAERAAADSSALAPTAGAEADGRYGIGTLPDNFVEVVYRKALRGRRRKKRAEAAEEEEEEEDDDDDARGRWQDESASRFGGSRAGGSSRWGGSQAGRRDPANNAYLEQQLSAVLGQYADDEIGELEEDDAGARGLSDLSAFDSLLDAHLAEHVELPTLRSLYDLSGAVGAGPAWAARQAALDAAEDDAADEAAEARLAARLERGGRGIDRPVPLSAEARARLALVPEEAADDDFDTHPFLRGLVIDEREEAEARWDCATIVSTYSNTENHPTLVRVRPRKAQERILLGPRGMPIGAHALPGVAAAAKAKSGAARRDDADGGGSDDDDDDDDESVITLGGAARQRGESAEEKRARKAAVKAERACRRMEKKQTKELFAKERTKAMHVVASAQPNGLQI